MTWARLAVLLIAGLALEARAQVFQRTLAGVSNGTTLCVTWASAVPSSAIDQMFIVPSRSERKYTLPLWGIGFLLVPA